MVFVQVATQGEKQPPPISSFYHAHFVHSFPLTGDIQCLPVLYHACIKAVPKYTYVTKPRKAERYIFILLVLK